MFDMPDLDLSKIDITKYPPDVQICLKWANGMRHHKAVDCAKAAVKVLAFSAWTAANTPEEALHAATVLFNEEIDKLRQSGIPQRCAFDADDSKNSLH